MAEAVRDQNHVTVMLFESASNPGVTVNATGDEATGRLYVDVAGGSGTVTSVSVVTANGFAGSVANATTTPAITLSTTINSPVLSGNGTALAAATTTGSGSTVVLNNSPTFLDDITIGTQGTATGSILFKGTTSGTVTLSVADAAGTWTLKLPTTNGNSGEFLQTDGDGNTTWAAGSAGITIGATTITGGTDTRILYDNAGVVGEYTLTGTGTVVAMATNPTLSGITMADATNIVINATTGTKIGTATTQKLAFYNSTPIVQPTGDVVTALQNLGLVASATVNATTVTVANEATDTSCFIAFFTAATGDLGPKTNVNMTFNSNTGVATFASTVLTTTDINGGTIDGTVIGGSSAAAGTFTTAVANSFVPNSSTIPTNGLYLPAANTLGWAINSAAEVQLTATALSPAVDGGNSLGTTALGWQNLFGNTGFVLNIENSDWVATHTAGILTVGTGDLRVTTAGTNTASVVTVGGTQTLTSKTLQAAIIDYVIEPAVDDTYEGEVTNDLNAGYTTTQWDLVYLASADSRWEQADADAAATSGQVILALAAVGGVTDGSPLNVVLRGIVRNDGWTWTTPGAPLYVSTTAGAMTETQPSGTDDVIRVVGYVISDDCIYFNPSTDWITHT